MTVVDGVTHFDKAEVWDIPMDFATNILVSMLIDFMEKIQFLKWTRLKSSHHPLLLGSPFQGRVQALGWFFSGWVL